MRAALVVVASALALVGCKAKAKDRAGDPEPSQPTTRAPAPPDAAAPAAPRHIDDSPSTACGVHDVELIYVVDDAHQLWSFDPSKLPGDPLHLVGELDCPTTYSPFSMAVDRTGIAWVLYNNGEVYRASIIDASCDADPAFTAGDIAPINFGMGYVTDGPKSTVEHLFVAADDDSRALARLDTAKHPAAWVPIGSITGRRDAQTHNPELTGTADGTLWGYFPEDDGGFIQEIARDTGTVRGKRLDVGDITGDIGAWAFAFWGGTFYVFATVGDNSTVRAVDRKTGKHALVLQHLAQRIVGAGVSTCAPLMERPAEVEQPQPQ